MEADHSDPKKSFLARALKLEHTSHISGANDVKKSHISEANEDGFITASKILQFANKSSALSNFHISPVLKRRDSKGNLHEVDAKEMGHLDTTMRLNQIAEGMATLSIQERIEWGLQMKDFANQLYRAGEIKKCMEKYLECLLGCAPNEKEVSASLLERSKRELQVPTLCNLAACALELGSFNQALAFCDQALAVDGKCSKALRRKGSALIEKFEYKQARECLRTAATLTQDKEEQRLIRKLLARTRDRQKASHDSQAKQREAIQAAMSNNSLDFCQGKQNTACVSRLRDDDSLNKFIGQQGNKKHYNWDNESNEKSSSREINKKSTLELLRLGHISYLIVCFFSYIYSCLSCCLTKMFFNDNAENTSCYHPPSSILTTEECQVTKKEK